MRAIETTATFKGANQLVLDSPVLNQAKSKVRLIILLPDEEDIDEKEWLRSASYNPAFDFLKDEKDDIYTHADGKPFRYEGI